MIGEDAVLKDTLLYADEIVAGAGLFDLAEKVEKELPVVDVADDSQVDRSAHSSGKMRF